MCDSFVNCLLRESAERKGLSNLPGWELIEQYPIGDPDGVGSWLLHHDREALLLECPPGLEIADVDTKANILGVRLKYIACSHYHEDHMDKQTWLKLQRTYPHARILRPCLIKNETKLNLGSEPLWLLPGRKHSTFDIITVFRGVAMTGDVELGMVNSVNREVSKSDRERSMKQWAGFEQRNSYHVHTAISAHLNDIRRGRWIDWFSC